MRTKIIQGETLSIKLTFLIDTVESAFDKAEVEIIDSKKQTRYISQASSDSVFFLPKETASLKGYFVLRVTVYKGGLVTKKDIPLEVIE
jgi:hypothetical protein